MPHVYVYHPASRRVLTGEVVAIPAVGETFVVGGVELVAERLDGETDVANVNATKIFARPAQCAECGYRLGSRAFHVKRRTYCGLCALLAHPQEHAEQTRAHEQAGLPYDDPFAMSLPL